MLCFKDMTFCKSDCTNSDCWRFFSEELKKESIEWMGEDAPIAFSDFSDVCVNYQSSQSTEREKDD